jgi:hypothetical protein
MIRSSVQRIWRGHGLQPRRVRQFKLVGGYAWCNLLSQQKIS